MVTTAARVLRLGPLTVLVDNSPTKNISNENINNNKGNKHVKNQTLSGTAHTAAQLLAASCQH